MSVFDNVKGQNKYLENLDRKDPRPSTNTTSMYEKSTTHVNRTYSQTYWFMYIDLCADCVHNSYKRDTHTHIWTLHFIYVDSCTDILY